MSVNGRHRQSEWDSFESCAVIYLLSPGEEYRKGLFIESRRHGQLPGSGVFSLRSNGLEWQQGCPVKKDIQR